MEREPEVRATLIVIAELARFARDLASDTEAACADAGRDIAEAAGLPPPTFEHGSCDALHGVYRRAVEVLSRGATLPVWPAGRFWCHASIAYDVVTACEAACPPAWRRPGDALRCGEDAIDGRLQEKVARAEKVNQQATCGSGYSLLDPRGTPSACSVHCMLAATFAVTCDGIGLSFSPREGDAAVARYQTALERHMLRRAQLLGRFNTAEPAFTAAPRLTYSLLTASQEERQCISEADHNRRVAFEMFEGLRLELVPRGCRTAGC